LLDPSLKGKTRAEMGLKEFTRTEIHSNLMGIPITINEEVIGRACRRKVEGSFQWNLNPITSVWKATICKFEKVNLPRYIFSHMIWALRESQQNNRSSIPYGGLLSEIFYQGRILNTLKTISAVSDDQLGTMVRKYINANTLKSMKLVKEVKKLKTGLKESVIVFDLMEEFPPISKEDHPVVIAKYVAWYFKEAGIALNIDQLPDTLGGAPLRIASKKRKLNNNTSEAVEGEASEPKSKKPKQSQKASKVKVESALPSIQEEQVELEPSRF